MARGRGRTSSKREVATIKEEPTAPMEIKDFNGDTVANFDTKMLQTIKDTVAQGATDSELYMFLQISSLYGLNPFLKEIWFTKMQGQVAIMTSRDGYLKIAKENPNFIKVQSVAVYQNDTFETEMINGEVTNVKHTFNHIDRGHLVGAYAFLKSKNEEENLFCYKDFKEYNKGNSVWKSFPSSMIRKVAENDLLKRFANINGITTPEEMGTEDLTGNYEYQEQPAVKSTDEQIEDLKEELQTEQEPDEEVEVEVLQVEEGEDE